MFLNCFGEGIAVLGFRIENYPIMWIIVEKLHYFWKTTQHYEGTSKKYLVHILKE
jgi:hypothetical protein